MSINAFEICSKCGYKIPRSEQAFVFERNIVCFKCDSILRNNLNAIEDISNIEYKTRKIARKKEGQKVNIDPVINNSSKANKKSKIEKILNISDFDIDNSLFTKSKEDYHNDSDDLFTANINPDNKVFNYSTKMSSDAKPQADSQKVKIQLPSFIHSCFIDRSLLTAEPKIKTKYRAVGGFVILLCIVTIIAIGTVLATRYLL